MNNKKRPAKETRRGGRGGGRGGRQKTVVRNHFRETKPLQERDVQENNRGTYSNEIVLVKDVVKKVPSRRGRPRSRAVDVPPVIICVPVNQPDHLPPKQLAPCQVVPRKPIRKCPLALPVDKQRTCQQPVHFRAQSMSIVHSLDSSQENEKDMSEDTDDNWPSDLEELLEEWDQLPGRHLWEVIKWLSAPEMPPETPLPEMPTELPLPHMVSNVQELMNDWDETYDNKIKQVMDWLGYSHVTELPPPPPKVVVEIQPASAQICSQWSSMADQREP